MHHQLDCKAAAVAALAQCLRPLWMPKQNISVLLHAVSDHVCPADSEQSSQLGRYCDSLAACCIETIKLLVFRLDPALGLGLPCVSNAWLCGPEQQGICGP